VTLAANLDLAAWTSHHKVSPMAGSLDRDRRPAMSRSCLVAANRAGCT